MLIFHVKRFEQFLPPQALLSPIEEYQDVLWSIYMDDLNKIVSKLKERNLSEVLTTHRLADWAAFASIVAEALEIENEEVDKLLENMEYERSAFTLQDDPLLPALKEFLKSMNTEDWMTASDLHKLLSELDERYAESYSSAKSLAKRLANVESELKKLFGMERRKNLYKDVWEVRFQDQRDKTEFLSEFERNELKEEKQFKSNDLGIDSIEVENTSIEYVTIKVIQVPPHPPECDCYEFVGVDGKTYRIEKEGQILKIPKLNAKPLLERSYVMRISNTKEMKKEVWGDLEPDEYKENNRNGSKPIDLKILKDARACELCGKNGANAKVIFNNGSKICHLTCAFAKYPELKNKWSEIIKSKRFDLIDLEEESNRMLDCPCGFSTSNKAEFTNHAKACEKFQSEQNKEAKQGWNIDNLWSNPYG